MNTLVALIRIAGALQLLDVAANLAVPRKIQSQENLTRVTPVFRHVFRVHWFYVMLTLVICGVACLLFAPELAAGSPFSRFLVGSLAFFWLSRAGVQVFYFESEFRRQNRFADLTFIGMALFLGTVFVIAAAGVVR